MRRALLLAAAISTGVLVTACGDDGGGGDDDTPTNQLANPAAVFCEDSGGTYGLDDGSCTLPDGRVVDGWEYFYENNPTESTSG